LGFLIDDPDVTGAALRLPNRDTITVWRQTWVAVFSWLAQISQIFTGPAEPLQLRGIRTWTDEIRE